MAKAAAAPESAPTPQYSAALAAFPFTIREWVLAGLGVLLLVTTFLPLVGGYGYYVNIWSTGVLAGISFGLVPLAAGALLVLRRLVPNLPWRVGSLTVDQFASVVGIVTAVGYFSYLVGGGAGLAAILGFIFSLGWVFFASFAHLVPPFSKEFTERPAAAPFSLLARPTVLALAQPVRPVYAAAPPVPGQPAAQQPFWALSPEERPVVDAAGKTLFTVGPAAWALVIEDRGTEYVIQQQPGGATGVLKDLSGVTKA